MATPFNLALHEHLLALGYAWQQHPAEYGDDGDGESGPMPWGHPAWDEYEGPLDRVFYSALGVAEAQLRDLQAEAFEASLADEDEGEALAEAESNPEAYGFMLDPNAER